MRSDLVVSDSAVLPHHCTLRHRGAFVELFEASSSAVVRIAGARVRAAELAHHGHFEIGGATVSIAPAQAHQQALPRMLGQSRAMSSLASLVRRVAPTSLPVLLRGETGTGKELVANALHQLSHRWAKPFVAVNSATVSGDLGTSHLFGHVSGAFTGASTTRTGAFREADGGTLFLDELGSLPLDAQAKLLRILEDGMVHAVGSDRPLRVDVRLIAATCEPLERRVKEGLFRADLYERISTCLIEVPPLRERREDIPLLARSILAHSEFAGWQVEDAALDLLGGAPLPGNIRELRNVLIHAALRCDERTIRPRDVVVALDERGQRTGLPVPGLPTIDGATALALLASTNGNLAAAARLAKLPRSTFRDLVRRHGPAHAMSPPEDVAEAAPLASEPPPEALSLGANG